MRVLCYRHRRLRRRAVSERSFVSGRRRQLHVCLSHRKVRQSMWNRSEALYCILPLNFQMTCGDDMTVSVSFSDVNECASTPCLNSATCLNGDGEFSCICRDGYEGLLCQTGNSYICLLRHSKRLFRIGTFCNRTWFVLVVLAICCRYQRMSLGTVSERSHVSERDWQVLVQVLAWLCWRQLWTKYVLTV